MREVKFRAWDTISNKFLYPWPKGFYLFGEVTCFDLLGQQLAEQGRDSLVGINDLIIEQFTGLPDKNGVDIYEGDVLADWQDRILGTVEFGRVGYDGHWNGLSGFMYSKNRYKDSKGDWYELEFYDSPQEVRVIGNIHENPELLDK